MEKAEKRAATALRAPQPGSDAQASEPSDGLSEQAFRRKIGEAVALLLIAGVTGLLSTLRAPK